CAAMLRSSGQGANCAREKGDTARATYSAANKGRRGTSLESASSPPWPGSNGALGCLAPETFMSGSPTAVLFCPCWGRDNSCDRTLCRLADCLAGSPASKDASTACALV